MDECLMLLATTTTAVDHDYACVHDVIGHTNFVPNFKAGGILINGNSWKYSWSRRSLDVCIVEMV
jgi:hypothetical protein